MAAYVICVNDSIRAVVLDNEKRAEIIMRGLKEIDYDITRYSFGSRQEYDDLQYWHVHAVEVL